MEYPAYIMRKIERGEHIPRAIKRRLKRQQDILFCSKHITEINQSICRKTKKPKAMPNGLAKYDRVAKALCHYAHKNRVVIIPSVKVEGINAVMSAKLTANKWFNAGTETPFKYI